MNQTSFFREPIKVVAALFGGLCSSILNMSLKAMMDTVPTWTLAFNLVTLPGLAYSLPALAVAVTPVETIIQIELYKAGLINVTDSLITAVEVTHEETVAASTNSVLLSPLIGASQIFVVNNAWSGALMLLGMALESRGIAAAAVIGSTGCICGAYVGGEIGITDGLWGFNSSLALWPWLYFSCPPGLPWQWRSWDLCPLPCSLPAWLRQWETLSRRRASRFRSA